MKMAGKSDDETKQARAGQFGVARHGYRLSLVTIVRVGMMFEQNPDRRALVDVYRSNATAVADVRSATDFEPMEVLDSSGRLIMINEAGRRLLGLESGAPCCEDWALLWPEHMRQQIVDAVATAKSGGTARFRGWRARAKGSPRHWDVVVSPLRGRDGQIDHLLAISKGIAESKQTKEASKSIVRRGEPLSEAADQLLRCPDPNAVIEDLCRKAMNDLDCQFFFNFLFDERSSRLRLNAYSGLHEHEARNLERLDFGIASTGSCAVGAGACNVACTARHLRTELGGSHGVTAYCCFPLMAYGGAIGTLAFGSSTRSGFDAAEIEAMETLSHYVAIAIFSQFLSLRSLKRLSAGTACAANIDLDHLGPSSSRSVPDEEWSLIERCLLPRSDQRNGELADRTRRHFEGILWICNNGSPWRELPEEYGNWNSVYRRFRRWVAIGALDNVAKSLRKEIEAKRYMSDNATLERRAYRKVMKIREMIKSDRPGMVMLVGARAPCDDNSCGRPFRSSRTTRSGV
jgi:PAS domain S-box-containing protein